MPLERVVQNGCHSVADAVKKGYMKLLVRTDDTDVVVVAIATLNRTKPGELWVAFGTGGHFRFIPIHEVAAAAGPRKPGMSTPKSLKHLKN